MTLCIVYAVFALVWVPVASAGEQNVWVQTPGPVPNRGWMESYHPVISGEPTTLKGVVQYPIADGVYEYEWDFGDGTPSKSGAVTDPSFVEAEHVYSGAINTIIIAKLTVRDTATGDWGIADYPVKIIGPWIQNCPETDPFKCSDPITVKRIAIEKALWWAHKMLIRDPRNQSAFVQSEFDPMGNVMLGGSEVTLNTIIIAQGFVDNGYKIYNDNIWDPVYTEDVGQMLNYLIKKLQVVPIGPKGCRPDDPTCCLKCDPTADPQCDPTCTGLPPRDPEDREGGMKDGLGVYFAGQTLEYEIGAALRLLATCGYSNEYWPNWLFHYQSQLYNWNYDQILQQMVDFLAWNQLYQYANSITWMPYSSTPVPGPVNKNFTVPKEGRGSWPYMNMGFAWNLQSGPMSMGDVAVGYWTVDGIRAAEKTGAVVPGFVREELRRFLTNNQDLNGSPASNSYFGEFSFGPARAHHLVERAGEGLLMLQWAGSDINSPEVQGAVGFINRYWNKHNYRHQTMWPWDQHRWSRGSKPCSSKCNPSSTLLCWDDCFSHFAEGDLYETGYWGEPCVDYNQSTNECRRFSWIPLGKIDELNIFGFLTITQGLQSFGGIQAGSATSWLRNYQSLEFFEFNYLRLMVNNQLADGSWDDSAWVFRAPHGQGWALMLLARLMADMDHDNHPSGNDCDDFNSSIHPGATEIPGNHIDENCNGMADDAPVDVDQDGYTTPADCDDGDPAIHPDATEECNGLDDNCNNQIDEGVQSVFYRDADGDGFGNLSSTTQACLAPEGFVSNSEDCDDSNPAIQPHATEICNGLDDDCDGATDESGYLFRAFQRPINTDGTSIFQAGQTIPVKISVTDCAGVAVSNAAVTIAVSETSNQVQGTVLELVESSGNANDGNLFRYDAAGARYIYNLSTKNYSPGSYKITAAAGLSGGNSVGISLK